jgi:3-deoxy-D-manno-octulosonate cytidylyltransferase
MMVVAVIPARYGSTRLPAKPLADICGKPMIQWVYEKAKQSKLCTRVCIATDDERIASVVRAFGGEVILTSPDIQNGTDRMAAVADQIPGDIFVNVQGDEPLIPGEAIDLAVGQVVNGKFDLATLRVPIRTHEELINLNVVKVLVDDQNRALYFSRYPVPYSRLSPELAKLPFLCDKHVGIYAYRRDVLTRISHLPPCDLERAESLEQLRALKAGIAIGVMPANFDSVGVDTPDDLEKVRRILG